MMDVSQNPDTVREMLTLILNLHLGKTMIEKKIVFVYNADSGKLNALKDAIHKVVKPSTYPCSLCAVTYGNLGMKREWKTFIPGLRIPAEFLHRDEFCAQFDCKGVNYPVAFLMENEKRTELISTEEMDATTTLDEMMNLVEKNLDR